MARILVASQWWGQLSDKRGNALRNRVATLKDLAGVTQTVYAADVGATPVSAFKSDELGTLPGYVEEGVYLRGGAGIPEIQVEAVSGTARADLVSVETRVAVIEEAPLNVQQAPYNGDLQTGINALPAKGGTIIAPSDTDYTVPAPLTATRNGTTIIGVGRSRTNIASTTGDLFTPGTAGTFLSELNLQHLKLSASAGHVIAPLGGIQKATIEDVSLVQTATNKRVWEQICTGSAGFIDNVFRNVEMTVPAASAVAAFSAVGTGGAMNSNAFEAGCRFNGGDNNPFFYIEEQTAATFTYNWRWRDCTFEICRGGLIHGYSAMKWIIEQITNWDMVARGASTNHGILLGKTSGGSSSGNRIIDYLRAAGALGGGFADIKFVSGQAGRNTVENSDSATLAGFTIDLDSTSGNRIVVPRTVTVQNANASTIGHRLGVGTAMDQVPAMQMGANLIVFGTAAPTVGTWTAGDRCINSTPATGQPNAWVCTVGGTPGTWVREGGDIQVFNASASPQTWTKPVGVQNVDVLLIQPGGGGGSGRRGAAGTVRTGGGGGGGGGASLRRYRASQLSATETVQVGLGGAGGAAVTADDTNGNAGSVGGATYFKSHGFSGTATSSGGAGAAGSTGSAAGGAGGGADGGAGGVGGASSTTANGASAASVVNFDPTPATGGGAGGTVVVGNTNTDGGAGGAHNGLGGGAAGTGAGGNGVTTGATGSEQPGVGGGGGAGGGGTGATGTVYGGGGGGGGGSLNGTNSGKGGDGAEGLIIVTSW